MSKPMQTPGGGKGPMMDRPSLLGPGTIQAVTLVLVAGLVFLNVQSYRDVAEIRKGLGDRLQQIETRMTQISAKLDQRAPAPRPSGPDPNRVYTVKYDGAPSKGPAAAPVTIAEFSDFQ